MKNKKLYIIITLIILSILFLTKSFIKKEVVDTTNIVTIDTPKLKKETTIVFLGDMMLARGVEASVKKNFGGDFNKLFENITEIKNADILFANLEGPISDVGNNVGSIYSFRMQPSALEAVKNAGFDIVSFANNHVGDWNMAAFKDTLSRLNDIEIFQIGAGFNKAKAEKPVIIEKNGVKFGFLGFSDVGPSWMEATENKAGILLASDPNLNEIIKKAKIQSDVLIVSFHWGEEYKLIHNKRQRELAHLAVDSGADLVIGHHPHVIQDTEEYNGKPIIYSLGNFIFDQYFSKNTMRGMMYSVSFENSIIKKTETKIITLNKKYQPEGIFTIEEIKKRDYLSSNTCPVPTKNYKDQFLLNVGQEVSLPDKTYTPKNLMELNTDASTKKGICITEETKNSFEKMMEASKKDGHTIKVSSGFRNYETQKALFANAIKNNGGTTSVSVAKPGHSEHQLGTTIDITGSSINFDSAVGKFHNTKEDLWLRKNAYLYGFIQSYPMGKEKITGYMYEPWHYRYVGIANAKKIIENNQTINEFLEGLE